jgi:signal recognition particle GTPase
VARRLRAPKVPTAPGTPRAPKHNQFNRQNRESRMREKMLDGSKQNYFKYDLQDIMKAANVGEEHVNSLIQSLWAKGSRTDIDEAKDFLREKAKEGIVPPDVEQKILRIIERYSTWR